MELPREIQIHIYRYLYDKWREAWKEVMREVNEIRIEIKYLALSRLMTKSWNSIRTNICIDCGNYYKVPFYSCLDTSCAC
jgi:hypothetical protein